jgi:hypothetical protein
MLPAGKKLCKFGVKKIPPPLPAGLKPWDQRIIPENALGAFWR